jgi:electron transfer flavoprotein alpha subunit
MILVLVEHDAGTIQNASLQALTFARTLGAPMHGVAFGEGGTQALQAAGGFGATTGTHVLADDGYAPGAWAQALADIAAARSPDAVVAAGTDRGHELLAHLGAKTSTPFVANCVAAERDGDVWNVSRQRWGGSLLEDARVHGPLTLFTIALHIVAAEPMPDAPTVSIDEMAPAFTSEDMRVRTTAFEAKAAGTQSLGDARLVVGGGRGVGSAEGFASLDALAAALGGTVGVSRAVTSAGWRPHAEQIGQTGERIAPDLYIACGISGASQHMVGCRGAKKLLVINNDPDAPILAKAHYAVVGDLHQVVPAITEELERRRS